MSATENTSTINRTVMHEGVLVLLGGREYVLPPMTLATRRRDIATRAAIEQGYEEAQEQDLLVEVLHECLRRNYPQLTREQMEEGATFPELLEAYGQLKDLEARLIADLGKRRLAAAVAVVA